MIFFFQAEDGIRDRNVTGVQTCALPISLHPPRRAAVAAVTAANARNRMGVRHKRIALRSRAPVSSCPTRRAPRSEERRVGKEWRSRWSPNESQKRSRGLNSGARSYRYQD